MTPTRFSRDRPLTWPKCPFLWWTYSFPWTTHSLTWPLIDSRNQPVTIRISRHRVNQTINSMAQNFQIEKHWWRSLFLCNWVTGYFWGKWMTSAAPPGHTDWEYVIALALKCPQFECIEGQTYINTVTHICSLLYRQIRVSIKLYFEKNFILKQIWIQNFKINFLHIFIRRAKNLWRILLGRTCNLMPHFLSQFIKLLFTQSFIRLKVLVNLEEKVEKFLFIYFLINIKNIK